MLAEGRRRGGKPGTGLSARSVRLTLGRLSAAYELAIADRLLTHNPCRYVRLPRQVRAGRPTCSAGQVRTFLAEAAADRLHAAWRMTVYGERRGEILGLRWHDVDLDAGTVTIGRSRVLADYQVIEKGPKSDNGYRVLPMDDALMAALQALRDRQVTEAMEAGEAYEGSGYVVADELGRPVHPEWFSDEFHRVRERAAWCGHTEAVNEGTYTHARPEDLAVAMAALSKIEKDV